MIQVQAEAPLTGIRMRNSETSNKNWFDLKRKIKTRFGKFSDADLVGINGSSDSIAVPKSKKVAPIKINSVKKNAEKRYQITVDVNLMHAFPDVDAMTTLKLWNQQGKIELVEAEPRRGYGWQGDSRMTQVRAERAARKSSTGLSFRDASALIFPGRDSTKLKMNEVNCVVHLVNHHKSSNEIFITHNLNEFIHNGRRERLLSSYGIVCMTPDEAVETLTKLEGWK